MYEVVIKCFKPILKRLKNQFHLNPSFLSNLAVSTFQMKFSTVDFLSNLLCEIIFHDKTNPCILGVTFDHHLKFNAYVKSLVTRILPRINILKALTGTKWGQQ